MNLKNLIRFLILLPSLFLGVVQAQTEGKFPLRVLALDEVALPEVFVKSGADYLPLEFSSIQPSESVQSSFANPLPLYKRHTSGGKEGFVMASQVTLPTGSKSILLLGWGGDKPSYLAIADNFSSSSNSDWILINGTKKQLAMQVGKDTQFVKVAPSGATPFRVMVEANQGASVNIAEPEADNKWKTFYSTYWPIYPDRRCLVLFVSDGDKIKVKKISDIKPQPSQ